MPITKIEVKKSWSAENIQFLIDATHMALVENLKISEYDRLIRFIEHRPECFAVPPGSSDNYTLFEISMFPGRTLTAKRNLYQGIAKRFGELGIGPKDILIVLTEVPMDNWGIRCGTTASDVDLGFDVNV